MYSDHKLTRLKLLRFTQPGSQVAGLWRIATVTWNNVLRHIGNPHIHSLTSWIPHATLIPVNADAEVQALTTRALNINYNFRKMQGVFFSDAHDRSGIDMYPLYHHR